MKRILVVSLSVTSLGAGCAGASVASFDSLTEGDLGYTFVDGGITFFGLDDRAGGGPVTFAAERADGTISDPGFSPPNALGFGTWAPGPAAAFSQCGSFWFSAGTVQTYASVDLFEWLSPVGNLVWLEAYRNGVLVNSTNIEIPANRQLNHWTLSVSGVPFDTLRINGTGTNDRGIFIGLIDNVVVAPAPGSALVLVSVSLIRRRR